MEKVYKFIAGPLNPKSPSDGLFIQIWFLKRLGLWPPQTEDKTVQLLYTIWSYFYRCFFLYMYTLTQILFFLTVEDLRDVAEGFFLLLTQIALIYKVEKFYSNRHRIQACEKLLRSSLYMPNDEEEDVVIKEAMMYSLAFGLSFLVLAHLTISTWALLPFLEEELRLPIAAWYPFSLENPWVFGLVYFYQVFGISMSACFNASTDTLGSAMIAQVNGQVRRLGIQLTKIGHKGGDVDETLIDDKIDDRMMAINAHVQQLEVKRSRHYGSMTKCVIYHESILQFAEEIQDIFKGPIFAQIFFSCIIICMTCFLMVNQVEDLAAFISSFQYLMTMVTQILLFCWIGNELIYSSRQLSEQAYFSNFQEFDKETSQAMIQLMQRTVKDITMKAGGVFEITLSLPTFMSIMKSSYSYFAVLQTMQGN